MSVNGKAALRKATPRDAAMWLHFPGPSDDKYRRGVLGARVGSAEYPGAAVLAVTAAWRTGVGLLRYVPAIEMRRPDHGLPSPAAAVLAAHPETVFGESSGRPSDAWLIGSGTDPKTRSHAESGALRAILSADAPVVVDAGALGLAAEVALAGGGPGAPAILTPHSGEFARLWHSTGIGPLPDGWPSVGRAEAVMRLADLLGKTILLKGSVTIIAAPCAAPLSAGPATPWLATAGTGDVLAGVLGALVACNAAAVREKPERLAEIGAAAAQLHDVAARIASGHAGASGEVDAGDAARGRPVTALDVANALPAAFQRLRA